MSGLHNLDVEWSRLKETYIASTNVGCKTWIAVISGIVSFLSYGCTIDFSPVNSNINDGEDANVTDDTALYIAADVLDDELNGVATERDGFLWRDDSIETLQQPAGYWLQPGICSAVV